MPTNAQRYRFSGHQTFPFRYSWLPKAVRAIERQQDVFFRDDAMVALGVGKNMVSSMRFWCDALKLAVNDGRRKVGETTRLGERLLGEDGWDPYLEYEGTLWLLHWQLVHTPTSAATWYLAFNKWNRDLFTRGELLKWLLDVTEKLGDKKTSRNSLKRDIDVFIRTYVPSGVDKRRPLEDTFDCPLVELGLIRELEDGLFQFNRGPKPTLPIEVFTFALMKYWGKEAKHQETLNFENVLYSPGSPGAAFKLSEGALAGFLEVLPAWTDLQYDETAGLRLLVRQNAERSLQAMDCLEKYYSSGRQGAS